MLHNPLGSQGRDKSELSPSCRARLWCGNDSSSTCGPPAPSAGNVNLGITQEEMLWGCSALKGMDCRAWIYPHLVSTMSGLTPQEHSGRAGSSISTGDTTGSPHIAPPAVWVRPWWGHPLPWGHPSAQCPHPEPPPGTGGGDEAGAGASTWRGQEAPGTCWAGAQGGQEDTQQQRLSVTPIINVSPLHFANNSRLSLSGDKWPL